MTNGRWDDPHTRTLAMHFDGSAQDATSLYLVLNGEAVDAMVTLPALGLGGGVRAALGQRRRAARPGRLAGVPRDHHPDDRGLPAGVRRAPLTAPRPRPAAPAAGTTGSATTGTSRTLPPGTAGGSWDGAGQALATSPSSGALVMPLWCGSTRTV